MADKKLNEVTKVTDMAYVPVIMSDGSIGQIAKSDLASVVAENIGIKRMSIEIQEGATRTIEIEPPYSGILSITSTTYAGYSLFYIRGYGSGPSRNSVIPLTTGGVTDYMEFSHSSDMSGFIVKNNTSNAIIKILLF